MADREKKKRRRRNRRRRRRRAQKNRQALVPVRLKSRRFRLSLDSGDLEIAAGHDGFLRGSPEPAVIAAAYLFADHGGELAVRTLFRYVVSRKPPCTAEPADVPVPSSTKRMLDGGFVAILLVAIEEDSGSDLQSLYAAIADVDALVVWPLDGTEPVPCPMSEVRSLTPAGRALQVGLQAPGGPPIDAFKADDYVGTSTLWLPCDDLTTSTECRAPIRSRDGRNDWTVRLWLRAR